MLFGYEEHHIQEKKACEGPVQQVPSLEMSLVGPGRVRRFPAEESWQTAGQTHSEGHEYLSGKA